jgi:hypothetical protein
MKTDEALEQHIIEYLQEHPDACDTLEGVARWWVMSQQITERTRSVQGALDRLKSKGVLEERRSPDGQTLYSLKGS